MKLLKLTALSLLITGSLFVLSSCETDAELNRTTDYTKTGIALTGAQVVPVSASPALGTMDVFYTRNSKILTYTINWSGLSGAVTGLGIHGLAPTGYASPTLVQTFSTSAIVRCATVSNTSCGTYKGTMKVDDVVVKEADLLNGVYYVNIRTAAYPAGEIRGQIRFQ
ncbi:MAG: CHRD domain-containing protein [Chitinophagaceae bacterium]|nr:CHRD domain-containing protein [Chitinophagaceae bacterium]